MGKNLACLAAGVVLGYFAAKLHLETKLDQKYAARAYNEIMAAQEHKRIERFEGPKAEEISEATTEVSVEIRDDEVTEAFRTAQDAIDELVSPENSMHRRIDDILDRAATAFTDYSAISSGGKSTGTTKVEEPPQEEVMPKPTVELITQLEFEMNEPDHDQTTFVYHSVDGVLTNEHDKPMDIKKAFGVMDESWFGRKSNDANTCHLRDNQKQIDFEVVRSQGSYAKDVLGQSDDE